MKTGALMAVAGMAGAAVLIGQLKAQAGSAGGNPAGGCTPSTGPDVIVGDLAGITKWGTVDGITGYSIGTTSCNIGDQNLQWDADTNNHPVIGQHLYRLEDGRFEQLGISWLKHGFSALTLNLCCTCQSPGNSQLLGVGCSDPYGASLNGDQDGFNCGGGIICGGLGPRWEVNASTGGFLFPYDSIGMEGDVIYKRLQVHNSDVDPEQNAGALYYAEGHYVTPDDAAAGNHHNNASYEQVLVGSFDAGGWNLNLVGQTVRQKPAIFAWAQQDPAVVIATVDDGSAGRFHLGYRVTDNGDGTWHYEYALHNLNSHRSARQFVVPVGDNATITNVGFHDVDYHSGDGVGGEDFDGTDWAVTAGGGSISWSTETEAQNPSANALRWGTLYNFRFDASTAPQAAEVSIGLYRAGDPASLAAGALGPSPGAPCPWDLDDDGLVGITDLIGLLGQWGTDPGGPPDFDGSGNVGIEDLVELLGFWGPCP